MNKLGLNADFVMADVIHASVAGIPTSTGTMCTLVPAGRLSALATEELILAEVLVAHKHVRVCLYQLGLP